MKDEKSPEDIVPEWKKSIFRPVYWMQGEEPYFMQAVTDYAEDQLLEPAERSFNLSIFYGKDTHWGNLINACRRYPMFAEKQVVILKEAQQLHGIESLAPYFEKPSPATIFVVAYQGKKLDGRSKLSQLLRKRGDIYHSKKVYEEQLPRWVGKMLAEKKITIQPKALALLIDHTGNDLTRIRQELDKIAVNLGNRTSVSQEDIEQFTGVSREFNAFELQTAIGRKDRAKAYRIIQYFESNPKAAPIQLVLPSLYGFFSKVYMIFGLSDRDEKNVSAALGVSPHFTRDYIDAASTYGLQGIEHALLLLHQYNLRSIGVGSVATRDSELLKELLVKVC